MRDELRRQTLHFLRDLDSRVVHLREYLAEGPTRYVDEPNRTAEERWADWGLYVVRQAEQDLRGLDYPNRAELLTSEERERVERVRPVITAARARLTRAGGRLLPADLPSPE